MKAFAQNSRIRNVLRRFHSNEGGMETLQVVVITAIAALIILMINTWVGNAGDDAGADTIGGWVNDLLGRIFDVDFGGTDG